MNYDLVVKNGTIIDGSGGARYRADVGILDGKIASIGRIDSKKAKTINVTFINTNNISDEFLKSLYDINYFSDEKNQLWETSLARIFLIHNAAKKLKVNKFIHFDPLKSGELR